MSGAGRQRRIAVVDAGRNLITAFDPYETDLIVGWRWGEALSMACEEEIDADPYDPILWLWQLFRLACGQLVLCRWQEPWDDSQEHVYIASPISARDACQLILRAGLEPSTELLDELKKPVAENDSYSKFLPPKKWRARFAEAGHPMSESSWKRKKKEFRLHPESTDKSVSIHLQDLHRHRVTPP